MGTSWLRFLHVYELALLAELRLPPRAIATLAPVGEG